MYQLSEDLDDEWSRGTSALSLMYPTETEQESHLGRARTGGETLRELLIRCRPLDFDQALLAHDLADFVQHQSQEKGGGPTTE